MGIVTRFIFLAAGFALLGIFPGFVYAVGPYPIGLPIDSKDVLVSLEDITTPLESTSSPQSKLNEKTISKPTKEQIKQLAKDVGLLEETVINPHLSFLDGDIAYWYEQGLSLDRLKLEFVARKAVLTAADRARVVIADQGKLSWAAGQIMANILQERAKITNNPK